MNPLSEIIRREIAQCGVLPFARFMERALYCPNHGYYEAKKDNPGRRGDFYTSVGVGEVFGQLLAVQFAEWLSGVRSAECGLPSIASERRMGVRIVEAGAHDGRLAGDILGWLRANRPELFGQMEYWIIEPSAVRQEWQRETLKDFAPRVRWLSRFNDLSSIAVATEDSTTPRCNGIIFSNELLDAMPVHRFGWDAKNKKWFEWGVALDGEKFVWARTLTPHSHPSLRSYGGQAALPVLRSPDFIGTEGGRTPQLDLPSSILHLPSSLLEMLPDGYIIEVCPAAENWWREAADMLEHGKLVTIDYGLAAEELFSPGRQNGTLRAYYRHHVSDDLLANVGEQDLTAHVNFSAIQKIGEEAGLKTESFQTQAQFLTQILAKASQANSLGEWSPARSRQFQTLTHPEHLGRAFRVLVQTR
jgi:SAM-dependent MidA family methyltransferase